MEDPSQVENEWLNWGRRLAVSGLGSISRVSGGKLRWRRLSLTSIWYFVLLRLRLTMCFEWWRHKCLLLWDWTSSDEVTPLILKRDLTVLAHLSTPHYLREVFSGKYISVGCSWTIASKNWKISILAELNSQGGRLFSSKAIKFS